MTDKYDCDGMAATGRSISDHGRRFRNLLLLLPPRREVLPHPQISPDRDRLLIPPPSPLRTRKKGFAAAAFRGLGCTTSSSKVHAPAATSASAAAAAVRSSADWQGKSSRSRKKKGKVKKEREKESKNQVGAAAVSAVDVLCAPGMGFSSAADASVDCLAPSFQQSRGREPMMEMERIQREDKFSERRGVGSNPEQLSSLLDPPRSPFDVPTFGSELIPPRHLHRARRIRRSPGGLDEIMMFQARFMLGEMDTHDRYRDWRLDVDSMTYEELLELGDRIGYVNTGLREEEIIRCLRKTKHTVFNASPCRFSSELERKCTICQEDYEANDEMGMLDCGHGYHMDCIKQWLLRRNACPVCKATVG